MAGASGRSLEPDKTADRNPFKSTDRENLPAFDLCFGEGTAALFNAFSPAPAAASPSTTRFVPRRYSPTGETDLTESPRDEPRSLNSIPSSHDASFVHEEHLQSSSVRRTAEQSTVKADDPVFGPDSPDGMRRSRQPLPASLLWPQHNVSIRSVRQQERDAIAEVLDLGAGDFSYYRPQYHPVQSYSQRRLGSVQRTFRR